MQTQLAGFPWLVVWNQRRPQAKGMLGPPSETAKNRTRTKDSDRHTPHSPYLPLNNSLLEKNIMIALGTVTRPFGNENQWVIIRNNTNCLINSFIREFYIPFSTTLPLSQEDGTIVCSVSNFHIQNPNILQVFNRKLENNRTRINVLGYSTHTTRIIKMQYKFWQIF